ncbi:hypothetical protein ZTR_11406 [Talaromyces verruculosus]|nr:hypothetical protein ZTR_11406 [Talaromyces verruculosus]
MVSVFHSVGESSRTRRKGRTTDDDESEASDVERATKYTRHQRQNINRIIKCDRYDYYGILDLSTDCTSKEVRHAHRKLAGLIHPDKNQFSDATSAFNRIQDAYENLIDPDRRRRYDKTRRKHYKPDGDWDEVFHGKAYGEESTDDDESGDGEEEEAYQYPELPQSIKNIYDDAAPAVNAYLSDPTEGNLAKINKYNEAIQKINEKDGRAPFTFIIKYTFFDTMLKELRPIAARLTNDPDDIKALDKLQELVTNFEKMKQNYGYSSSWKAIPDHMRERLEQRARQSLKNDKRRKQNKESAPPLDSDTEMESQAAYPVSRSTWNPGETELGERILGYRPFYRTDIISMEKNLMGLRFIIEQKNKENPIALVSGADIGRQAVRAYMSLSDLEKYDITNSDKKWGIKDLDDFDEIIGAAGMPFKNKAKSSNRIYPDGYFLVRMKDGGKHIMNRQAVRKILGETNADRRIAAFYKKVRETPPWEIEPLNWRPQRLLFDRPEIGGDRRTREGMLNYHVADSDHELRLDQVRQRMRKKKQYDWIDKYIEEAVADRLKQVRMGSII